MSIDIAHLDGLALMLSSRSGFFERSDIHALPGDGVWEEMALDLRAFAPLALPATPGIRYGFYDGDIEALRAVVRRVDAGWTALYSASKRIYCGFDGDRVASFCLVEDMGTFDGLRIGGPGCVGTLPEYRRRGIGLKMVQDVTAMLRDEGFDLGYIHYTGVARWYARLGYRTTLRWNRNGPLESAT